MIRIHHSKRSPVTTMSGNAATDPSPTDLPQFTDSIQVVGDIPFVFPVAQGESITIRFGIGELDYAVDFTGDGRRDTVLHVGQCRIGLQHERRGPGGEERLPFSRSGCGAAAG